MDISILLALQNFREGAGASLVEFFNKMTFLGELNVAILIMGVLYWCVSKEFGSYLLLGWSGNRLVNGVLKVTACAYRPWIRDARIVPYGNSMTTATGYSFPSGHTMNATSVFGGGVVRKDLPGHLRFTLCLIMVLVGLSRNFLGVHTPQDVLVGFAAGLVMMFLTVKIVNWVNAHPERDMIVVAIGIVLAILVAVYAAVKSYPADYDAEGKILVDGAKMALDTFKGVGYCTGILVGWILERRFVKFTTEVSRITWVTRLVTGTLSYYAVSLVIVPLVKNAISGAAGNLISCFLQVFFVTFIFPWCIKHFEKA